MPSPAVAWSSSFVLHSTLCSLIRCVDRPAPLDASERTKAASVTEQYGRRRRCDSPKRRSHDRRNGLGVQSSPTRYERQNTDCSTTESIITCDRRCQFYRDRQADRGEPDTCAHAKNHLVSDNWFTSWFLVFRAITQVTRRRVALRVTRRSSKSSLASGPEIRSVLIDAISRIRFFV